MSRRRADEIAIVGMGCRFPGANDLSTFWENIVAGKDCTREVPRSRWNAELFHDANSTANDRVPCRRGGYLDEPITFDAARHGIMPRTVEGGEPEQFVVLDAAVAALEDAGLSVGGLPRGRVEVVIGRGNYFNRGNLTRLQHGRVVAETMAILEALHPEWSQAEREAVSADFKRSLPPFEAGTIPGQLTNATAGRIANRLDLSGAAYVVDAASASSLVALELAMRSLGERRADLAIAGGVYLEADVDFPLVFRQLGALSPTGVCRPFSADADGLLPGEGSGVVVLKRRTDAERDGNRIYAVIRGVGLASDGRGRGLTAPSAHGHARAMRRAYRRARINPGSVTLIEGHGLGVPAADRAELRALAAVFPAPERGQRFLGAVSSMIGHAMPAAGVAGIIKAALSLYHRVLPPSLHGESQHAIVSDATNGLRLNRTTRPWIHAEFATPRRAAVNSFGFAGINAHAVLEEHAASSLGKAPGALRRWDSECFLLAAEDRSGLRERARWLIDRLEIHEEFSLKDIAYTLNCDRGQCGGRSRVGVVASSVSELKERLSVVERKLAERKCQSIRDGRGIYFWDQPLLGPGKAGLAFLFPGEGSQYPGMLADLCLHFPEVVERFDIADRIALELGETVAPSEFLFGEGNDGASGLWTTANAVNIVLSSQWALYQLVTRLGLAPDAVVGHSSGELLAMAAAGMFETDRALELQLGRLGSIFRGLESSGALPAARLVAVAGGRERVESICREVGAEGVLVAMDNCPHQVVLAGPPAEVAKVTNGLREANLLWEELPFERAYHTASFGAVMGPIEEFFAGLSLKQPRLPIYSCASKGVMPGDIEGIREVAVSQWTRAVAFRETIEVMHKDGMRVFVDIGARGNLAGFVDDTLRGKPAFAIAANLPRRSGLTQLNHLVAATFAQGVTVRPECLYVRRRPVRLDWDAPVPAARAMIELKIGFPEMRLSEAVAKRLRSSALTEGQETLAEAAAATQSVRMVDEIDGGRAKSMGIQGEDDRSDVDWLGSVRGIRWSDLSNDDTHETESHSVDAARSAPNGAEPACEDLACVSFSRVAEWETDLADSLEHWPSEGSSGRESTDGGVLAFQETMRSFLVTQQAVMGEFLGMPAAPFMDHQEAEPPEAGDEFGEHEGCSLDEQTGFDDWANVGQPMIAAPTSDLCVSGLEPGPWSGEIHRLVANQEVETVFVLDQRHDAMAKHHTLGGRKVSAIDPTLLGLPVVPFAMMAEMAAEVAALLVTPGLVLTTISDLKAHKWIRYEAEPVILELRGRRLESADFERAWVGIYNRGTRGDTEASRPVFEAVASFGIEPPAPPLAAEWVLENSRASRFTAESIYREQWLFHGPPLQAVSEMGRISAAGIDGKLRVLPWEPLFENGESVSLHTDPIILDSFTHLLGCWGLDWMADRGDVMFPLSMEQLEVFGNRPAVGSEVFCRISIPEVELHRVRVNAEVVRTDGTVWLRLSNWEDWRFHWPGRYRDVFRQPRDYFAGETVTLADPEHGGPILGACVVWLEPPGDMGRPVWRDVLEQTQLGPQELAVHLAAGGPERRRSQRLWGRVAAKEAARRLWQSEGAEGTYPADLAIVADERGKPLLVRVNDPECEAMPAISIAHTEGVAVALASIDGNARVGIDVERIEERPAGFDLAAFGLEERALLQGCGDDRQMREEWVTRFWCAKEAAAKSTGLGLCGDASAATVCWVHWGTGTVGVRLGLEQDRSKTSEAPSPLIRVFTARRGEYAWAWTLGEGADE